MKVVVYLLYALHVGFIITSTTKCQWFVLIEVVAFVPLVLVVVLLMAMKVVTFIIFFCVVASHFSTFSIRKLLMCQNMYPICIFVHIFILA